MKTIAARRRRAGQQAAEWDGRVFECAQQLASGACDNRFQTTRQRVSRRCDDVCKGSSRAAFISDRPALNRERLSHPRRRTASRGSVSLRRPASRHFSPERLVTLDHGPGQPKGPTPISVTRRPTRCTRAHHPSSQPGAAANRCRDSATMRRADWRARLRRDAVAFPGASDGENGNRHETAQDSRDAPQRSDLLTGREATPFPVPRLRSRRPATPRAPQTYCMYGSNVRSAPRSPARLLRAQGGANGIAAACGVSRVELVTPLGSPRACPRQGARRARAQSLMTIVPTRLFGS